MGIENPTFYSGLYVAPKLKRNATVSLRNIILVSIESKSWTGMEYGILLPEHATYQNFLNFWIRIMSDFTRQNFLIQVNF